MARRSKLNSADKFALRHIVNKLHVATPDATIEADLDRRCEEFKLLKEVTPGWVKAAKNYALKQHRGNQNLFTKNRF